MSYVAPALTCAATSAIFFDTSVGLPPGTLLAVGRVDATTFCADPPRCFLLPFLVRRRADPFWPAPSALKA